jgi:hypothetical protein
MVLYIEKFFLTNATDPVHEARMASNPGDPPSVSRADPSDRPDTARGLRLLVLIRGLIAFGHAILATLNHPPNSPALRATLLRFATRNLDLIVARVLRGLCIAEALERRVLAAGGLDAKRDRPRARPARREQPKHQKPPTPEQDEDDAALLACLPTAEEIAALVRRRPLALVLEDICRDFGIAPSDPIWEQVWTMAMEFGYRGTALLNATARWASLAFFNETMAADAGSEIDAGPAPGATGPPFVPMALAA